MEEFPFRCCVHCGCGGSEAIGHDDTCSHGCNDDEIEAIMEETP